MKSRKFARCLVVLSWRNFSPLFRPSAGSHRSANTKIFSYWFLRPARAIATGRCETWSKIIPLFCLRRGNKLLQYFRARFRVRAPASVCTPEYISQSFGPRWVKSEISYSRGWMSRVKIWFLRLYVPRCFRAANKNQGIYRKLPTIVHTRHIVSCAERDRVLYVYDIA